MRSVLPCVLLLAGCAGLPGTGAGGTAGGAQPATNLAQTARDQAAVPSQAYGGDVNMMFASSTPGEVTLALIEYAKTTGADLKDLTEALKATNGAPEVVTITQNDVEGGSADAAGSGTGGAGTATGGGTVAR